MLVVAAAAAPAAALDRDALARIGEAIAAREYRAGVDRAGRLQAPNRVHALRTYFEPWGIQVQGRSEVRSGEPLGLALARLGREGALRPIAPGEVVALGTRVEIRRRGLVEWYVNSPAGLEQGFTLTERPAGTGELCLELAVHGGRARLVPAGVALTTAAGLDLRYGGLVAYDTDGRRLEAHLEAPAASRLRLRVEDEGARYPVVIDPLLTGGADTTLVAGQAGAQLGFRVAGAGDVDGDAFDDVIVGAPFYDAGEVDEGAAFVFLGSPSGIAGGDVSAAAAQLESDQAGAQLGISVAGAGDVDGNGFDDVLVGARRYDAGETDEGAAFVFLGSATGIADGDPASAAARLESDQGGSAFGSSVAGAGDVNGNGFDDVIVGAPLYDSGQTDEGAAFVFLGSASGIASAGAGAAAARLESDQAFALLGLAVAGAGSVDGNAFDEVIVGAPLYDAGETDEGAAFIFLGSASGIASAGAGAAAAQLESDQAFADLGFSVAGAGDVNGDDFDDVIVGADEYDAPESSEGAAFVFLGGASGIPDGDAGTAAAQLESNQAGADFGISVAGVGDVDADGFDDVIVGAYLFDGALGDAGAAFVFRGSSSGIADGDPSSAFAQLDSDQADAEFGWSVASAGDVDGNGIADVVVGARSYAATFSGEGAAFIYLGGLSPNVPALGPAGLALLASSLLGAACLLFRRARPPRLPGGARTREPGHAASPASTQRAK